MTGAARRGRHSWDGDMRNSELLSNDPVLLIRGVGVFLYRGKTMSSVYSDLYQLLRGPG